MKKVLLFLFALLTAATVWAQEFTPLQMGVDNDFVIVSNDGLYLSFTPEVTDYYVISTTCAESHQMAFNLWSDSLLTAHSEPDELQQTHISNCGYPKKLYAGCTYKMGLYINRFTSSVSAHVVIRKGYLVSPDAESADLMEVMTPLPAVAYEGQEVRLNAMTGVTINNLSAVADGEPVAVSVDDTGLVFTFTMPAADVVISGSYEVPTAQLGDNEVSFNDDGALCAFTPSESGVYVFSMNCSAPADIYLLLGNYYLTNDYTEEEGTLRVGAMLEANETYFVSLYSQEDIESKTLNITKRQCPAIIVGENVIEAPAGIWGSAFFDYSFTPPVSGEYTFCTSGDAELYPWVQLLCGDEIVDTYIRYGEDLRFTVDMQAGVAYTLHVNAGEVGISTIHLTVVSPPLPSFAVTLAEALASGSNGDNVTLSDTLAVVQKTCDDDLAYVTDGNGHWARLEGDAVAGLVVGSGISGVSGELTNMGTAPTIVLAGAPTEADAPDYQIMPLDLQHEIAEPPAPCQVVSVSGFYDGMKVRAFRSEPQGQGLLINADHASLAMQVGKRYDIVGAIELLEPWDDDASGAPQRIKTTDDDFLNNIYLMLISGEEKIDTGITDLAADHGKDIEAICTLDGLRVERVSNGVYIIKFKDGSVKKVMF